jgi:4-hydroxy-tetrahydrodipicolinate synthase
VGCSPPTKEERAVIMIEGLFVPQFTIFNKDQKVDYVATKEHGAWLLGNGVTGLVPFGTFGEGSSLSLSEKKRVTTDLLNITNGKMLIPTIISNSLAEIQEYLEFAEDLPIAGVMVSPPSYYRPVSDENLIEFYRLIARKTTHPIIAYNIPATVVTLSSSVASQIPIWGVKDSSGIISSAEDFLSKKVKVLVGSDSLLIQVLEKGASGGICGLGNIFPAQMAEVYRKYRGGHLQEAEETLKFVIDTVDGFLQPEFVFGDIISAVKEAGKVLNNPNLGTMRLPVGNVSLSPDALAKLKAIKG